MEKVGLRNEPVAVHENHVFVEGLSCIRGAHCVHLRGKHTRRTVGECWPAPGALLFYLLSRLQPHSYPFMEKLPKQTTLDCIIPAFSGSPWWGEINMATSPLPSWGPHGGERSIWLHHLCLLGSAQWGEINMATSPLPSRGPHSGEESIWVHNPCLLGVPMVGRNQYGDITPAFSGSPWWGEINLVRSGCGGNEENMDEKG